MEITAFHPIGMRLFDGGRSICRRGPRTTLTAFQLFFLGRAWAIIVFQGSCPEAGFSKLNATMRAKAPSIRHDGFTVVTSSGGVGYAAHRCINIGIVLPSGVRTHTVLV